MRAMISSGTLTRSSFFMNSALRSAGQRPDAGDDRESCSARCAAMNSSSRRRSKTGWVTAYLRRPRTLYSKRRISSSMSAAPGLAPTPMTKRGGRADGVAADIEAAIEVVDDVHQSDSVHVEDSRGVGIVAQLGRIAGDADEVVDAHGAGAQQVRLDAEDVAVAAGVVQHGLNADIAA